MNLEGIHHVTAITGDAPGNVDFYTRVLGLRMAAKSVNQDDPTIYHLFYSDELGRAGSDITFFEYPGAIPGRAGAGGASERDGDALRFAAPEGLGQELVVRTGGDEPLSARHPEIPPEHA